MTDDNITTITGAADPESGNNETMGSLEFSETAPVPQEARKTDIIQAKKIIDYIFPTDKPNSFMWNYTADIYNSARIIDGKTYRYIFITGKNSAGEKSTVTLTLHFDSADDKLSPYDKRVYLACFNLYNSGNTDFSVNQIYKAMGHCNRATPSDYSNICMSLAKMNGVKITIDTSAEREVFLKKRKQYISSIKKDAPYFLLRFYWSATIINGQACDATVCLMEEPILMTFARERDQITSIPPKLLQRPPRSRTPANLSIEDCLITFISQIKNKHNTKSKTGKRGRTFADEISHDTICERCGLTTKKQKQDAYKSAVSFLDSFIEKEFITGYDIGTNKNGKPKFIIKVTSDEKEQNETV